MQQGHAHGAALGEHCTQTFVIEQREQHRFGKHRHLDLTVNLDLTVAAKVIMSSDVEYGARTRIYTSYFLFKIHQLVDVQQYIVKPLR